MSRPPAVAVIGPGRASARQEAAAHEIGAGLARAGLLVVTGGLGGVMQAACRGASEAAGQTLCVLPGPDSSAANHWCQVVVPTGLGEARNALVVRAAQAVVAIGGAWGTLSEIALALRGGVPVFGIETWELRPPPGPVGPGGRHGIERMPDPASAVTAVVHHLQEQWFSRGKGASNRPERTARAPTRETGPRYDRMPARAHGAEAGPRKGGKR